MVLIDKITTQYNENEDRFSVAALASNKSSVTLWFSQRMLRRLIPPILEWLDERNNASSQLDMKSKALMNDFASQKATNDLVEEEPAVQTKPISQKAKSTISSFLIFTIDIKHSDSVMELTLKDANDNAVGLRLTKLHARQWLMILQSQWLKSEWPMSIWPDWLTQSSDPVVKSMH